MLTHFYTGRRNATNKSCLFDAKFFEFEEFSIDTFFCSSIQPQHAVILNSFPRVMKFRCPAADALQLIASGAAKQRYSNHVRTTHNEFAESTTYKKFINSKESKLAKTMAAAQISDYIS